jgi:GntR family transcriptional repressor for pyruvate dehydrogenase complex
MQIVKANITRQVSDYLKENLEKQIWREGEKIPSENQLTKMLDVSRISVRMAIQQLIGIGALKSAHGKGTFVVNSNISGLLRGRAMISEKDYQDIRKVLEYREVVEPGTCYLAVKNATKENIENLQKYFTEMKNHVGDSKGFVRADMLFHEEIGKASGNVLLEHSLTEVFEQRKINHEQINGVFGYSDGIHFHDLILQAFLAGDAAAAKKYMREHLRKALRGISP